MCGRIGARIVFRLSTARRMTYTVVAAAPQDLLVDGKLPPGRLVVASEYARLTSTWIEERGLDATFVRMLLVPATMELLGDRLEGLADAVEAGHRVLRVIWQNIVGFAVVFNILAVIAASLVPRCLVDAALLPLTHIPSLRWRRAWPALAVRQG